MGVAWQIFIFKPKIYFCFGWLYSVWTVANVPANIDAEVTSDSARLRIEWFGCTKHFPACSDWIITFPYHSTNRPRTHMLHVSNKEFLLSKVSILLFHVLLSRTTQLHCDKLESFLLKSLNNLSDEPTLHPIRLNHDECALFICNVLLNIHLGITRHLYSLDSRNIVVEVPLKANVLSKLLNTRLWVIIILNCEAVLFRFSVMFKSIVEILLQKFDEKFVWVNFSVFFFCCVHHRPRKIPDLLHR